MTFRDLILLVGESGFHSLERKKKKRIKTAAGRKKGRKGKSCYKRDYIILYAYVHKLGKMWLLLTSLEYKDKRFIYLK